MTIRQARNLKPGDKVKQKMQGYIMTVDRIEECSLLAAEYINIFCKTDSGSIMKHTHKELLLVEDE